MNVANSAQIATKSERTLARFAVIVAIFAKMSENAGVTCANIARISGMALRKQNCAPTARRSGATPVNSEAIDATCAETTEIDVATFATIARIGAERGGISARASVGNPTLRERSSRSA
jgi:hypothetical protein